MSYVVSVIDTGDETVETRSICLHLKAVNCHQTASQQNMKNLHHSKFSRVSLALLTPVINNFLKISPKIFVKFEVAPIHYLWEWGKLKISCQASFNTVIEKYMTDTL
jgi:hypothetical protein